MNYATIVYTILTLSISAYVAPAYCAGRYDGKWVVSPGHENKMCIIRNFILVVNGDKAQSSADEMEMTGDVGVITATGVHDEGTISSTGKYVGTLGGQPFTGKFHDEKFEGKVRGPFCHTTIVLARVQSVTAPGAEQSKVTNVAKPDFEPPLPKPELIPTLSDVDLALSALSAIDILSGSTGVTYEAWRNLKAEGKKGIGKLTYGYTNSDGSEGHHVFETFDELDRFMAEVRNRQEAYAAEVKKRGYATILTKYRAVTGKNCAKRWLQSGDVTVDSHGFLFVPQQEKKKFIGAVVGNSVVIGFPDGWELPLIGTLTEGAMKLSDMKNRCVLKLSPSG